MTTLARERMSAAGRASVAGSGCMRPQSSVPASTATLPPVTDRPPARRALSTLGERTAAPTQAAQLRPRATVAVLNYNGRRFLDVCLEAVLAQQLDEGGFEVLLLDNGSEDGSLQHVRARFPEVRPIALGRNVGYTGANNVA